MDMLLGPLVVLLISAFVVDWLLKDDAIVAVRHEWQTAGPETRAETDRLLHSATLWFCRVFDAVYGRRSWSIHRFYRSTVLSIFFVLFAILIVGIDNTYLKQLTQEGVEGVVTISLFFGFVNVFGDFISLQETRWVMECVKRRPASSLGVWVIVDVMLTSAIYIVLFSVCVFGYAAVVFDIKFAKDMMVDENFLEKLFAPEVGLPFFASTFATSIVWYLFVLFVVVVRFGGQNSAVLKVLLDVVFVSATPASITVGLFAIPIAAVFGVVKLIAWLF